MPLSISGCDIDESEENVRLTVRRKLTGMLLVVIPQLKKILKTRPERKT